MGVAGRRVLPKQIGLERRHTRVAKHVVFVFLAFWGRDARSLTYATNQRVKAFDSQSSEETTQSTDDPNQDYHGRKERKLIA